jgi:hypothetical protein
VPRGAKSPAWNPKLPDARKNKFFFLDFEHPRRRPETWQPLEFRRLGMEEWPKEVGFFNAGDNFELTPEFSYRLFEHNRDAAFWTAQHNERTIIALLPLVEKDPAAHLPRVETIFQAHVERFGVDHLVYNAALQAVAFARDLPRCEEMLREMVALRLEPNAQTYVTMMLAARLAANSKEKARSFFDEAVRTGALHAVMRLDTEFEMWWAQLERMGSFTESRGYLSVNEEGARPRPRDVFAIWGWDRDERKFRSRQEYIAEEAQKRTMGGAVTAGTVWSSYKREPWWKNKGMRRADFVGPPKRGPSRFFADAPPSPQSAPVAGKGY